MVRVSRRQFALGGLLGGVGVLAATGWQGYEAYAVAPFVPRLERVHLPLPPEHAHLAGLTIGFVADTHLGPAMREADVTRALDLVAAEQPDLVLLGGDYISASPRYA